MPPDMAISMRHTKLKAEEAALLAGEISKPSWESRNEGIHERVTFEDTIWGFNLAGGVFYNTPLRVTYVKPDSRAEKAGIRAGDKLKRINDLDTSTLTIQQAHDIIVESGIHLKISVTSPEDDEDSYYCYEDPLIDGYDSEEERRLEEEKAKKRRVCARVSHFWSLQWPWVSKKRLVYRESNCFMVPSKYEDHHREKYPPLPTLRFTDDIVHFSVDGDQENQDNTKRIPSLWEVKQQARKDKKERLEKGDAPNDITRGTHEPKSYKTDNDEPVSNKAHSDELVSNKTDDNEPISNKTGNDEPVKEKNSQKSRRSTLKVERQETIDESKEEEEVKTNEKELNEDINEEINEEINNEINEAINDQMNEDNNEVDETAAREVDENNNEVSNDLLSFIPERIEENNQTVDQSAEVENAADNDNDQVNGEVNDDDVLNEVLGKTVDSASRSEEDNNILDSILSDEGQNLENSESNNER